eukprot:GDKI01009241.1.p2 GENE.GDKI01009241.1~~GDKI01009241.1.p2  ORF type:complete len:113 (-),score=20.86 GDKI01009241.1:423-761(-)
MVLSGKDKKQTREILATDFLRNMVKIKGCNVCKLHFDEKKIHYSNVMLLDPVTKEPTRVALRNTDDGQMVRISKKTGADPTRNAKPSLTSPTARLVPQPMHAVPLTLTRHLV